MKPEFMVERQGKQFVLYAGLLDEAHAQGLANIDTEIHQLPSDENGHCAVVVAHVTTSRGTFCGIGDASPENVTRMIVPHIIRMAETRAKARALRDAINVGVTALEELGGDVAVDEPEHAAPAAPRPAANRAPAESQRPASNGQQHSAAQPSSSNQATPAQVKAIYTIARKEQGMIEKELEEQCLAQYGKLPADLDKRTASELITKLQPK